MREDIEKLREYAKANVERFKREIGALAKAEKWSELRSYFHYATTPEERAVKAVLWGRFFLPHYFRDDTPDFHYEMAYLFFTTRNEYYAAPRGTGKTSLDQCFIAFSIAHKIDTFIVLIEKTFTEAAEVLGAVRSEFIENPMLRAIYGDMIGKEHGGSTPDKVKDAEGDMFINGVRLRAKGFDVPVRGLKSKEHRPSRIILDDVESDAHVRSTEQRRKYAENYTQGVIPAVDIQGVVKVKGTILHEDSLLKNLIDQHDGIIYSMFDPRLNILTDKDAIEKTLLWPARWTYDALLRKYNEMQFEGLGSGKFAQEYLNQVLSDDTRFFKWEWLQNTFTDDDLKLRTTARFATFDVAESKNHDADDTGLAIVDWDVENQWFVQHVKARKVNAPELIDWIFEVWQVWKPARIGVEKKAFEDQVKPWLKIKSEELGVYPIVVELEHGGRSKEDRVRGALQGRLEAGKILFKAQPNDDTPLLRGQLYDFPRGKKDDLADCLAYISVLGSRPYSKQKEIMSSLEREFFEYKKMKSSSAKSISNKL